MSLDADHTRLTRHGRITITEGRITVARFDGENASCRDVAVLALAWAIGELQREMVNIIEQPGGSTRVVVD